jgi:predicted transcriptional regulator of viral defense system
MDSAADNKILRNLGVFTTSEAIDAGFSQPTISRKAVLGEIIRLAHGFYVHPEAKLNLKDIDFILACKRFGAAAYIGGLSSLFRHGLINQVPDRVWVVVPAAVKSMDSRYRCIRSTHVSQAGVVNYKNFRMANVHRSIIDGLYYSAKIGRKTAISAARKALREGMTSEKNLYEIAKKADFLKTLDQYWDAITSE